MKKILSFILSVVICFGVVGCNKENSAEQSVEERNIETRAILTAVLNKEKSFIVHNHYINITSEETLEKFRYPTFGSASNIFSPEGYMFVDFDADGIDELLIVDAEIKDFLFLHCEGDEVYGCVHRNISLGGIKTDGSFRIDNLYFEGYEAICNISFDEETSVITNKAYRDEEEGIYLLDEKDAPKEDVEKYFEDWDKNTTSVSWERVD